ncbi:MAG: glutamate--tRNA ligase, partial [Gemmatimonadaceae bacterium]
RHQADARRLLDAGAAYRCFCTREELDERRKEAEARRESFKYDRRCDLLAPEEVTRRLDAGTPFVIRFRVPEGETEWIDAVHERISFPNKDIEDFVILRSDGTPIYNLAVVSDDIAMRITIVMRGDDHISNTPKQIMLYRALGAELPTFAHLPMIHGLDGKKLSKRHGATAVADYQHMGILPQAMLNFLALLGWSPGHDIEVMTLPQMVELFSVDGLLKKASVFDTAKLEWMNGQHLSMMTSAEIEPRVTAAIVRAGLATAQTLHDTHDWYLSLLDQLKVRSRTVDDIVRQARPYLSDEISYDAAAEAKQWKDRAASAELLAATGRALSALPAWDPALMEEALRALADARDMGGGKVFQPLRLALTGLTVSPGIFDVLRLLGRERSLARIDAAVRHLDG